MLTKKRKGPLPTGKGTLVGVRLQPDQLAVVDQWAEENGGLSRPEAVRRLVARGVGQTSELMRRS